MALPLLFIAGIQLYILSEQTEIYFAWTISLPLTAAFLGAGYWAAMGVAYMNWWDTVSIAARTTGLTASPGCGSSSTSSRPLSFYGYGLPTGAAQTGPWVRAGNLFQAVVTLPIGTLLFVVQGSLIPFWPWELTPLTTRTVSAWFIAYGLACVTVNRENNTSKRLWCMKN